MNQDINTSQKINKENYTFKITEGYKPGHCEMFYGQGTTYLGGLEPKSGQGPSADFTVSGEWDFSIETVSGRTGRISGRYTRPEQITPEIEKIIKKSYDGETFTHKGVKHIITWNYNNWFEIFVNENDEGNNYESGVWEETVGPTAKNMEEILFEAIEAKSGPPEPVTEGCGEEGPSGYKCTHHNAQSTHMAFGLRWNLADDWRDDDAMDQRLKAAEDTGTPLTVEEKQRIGESRKAFKQGHFTIDPATKHHTINK